MTQGRRTKEWNGGTQALSSFSSMIPPLTQEPILFARAPRSLPPRPSQSKHGIRANQKAKQAKQQKELQTERTHSSTTAAEAKGSRFLEHGEPSDGRSAGHRAAKKVELWCPLHPESPMGYTWIYSHQTNMAHNIYFGIGRWFFHEI